MENSEMIIEQLSNEQETIWINPHLESVTPGQRIRGLGFVEVRAAQARWMRFMPYLNKAFPDTRARKGIVESDIIRIAQMQAYMQQKNLAPTGSLYVKADHKLPIAGSVKARGGVYEVLKLAEEIAQHAGMLHPTDDYGKLDSEAFRDLYGQYTIHAGSTGNLGISIGITASKLGFHTVIHMSSDARTWKKELLRQQGVEVREYAGDYSAALASGREEAEQEERCYFIDDENSRDLFMGYATAGLRTKVQLFNMGISVDAGHPLFVYLPCGVGGAPGGITFGLKQMYGDHVHCFFVEPVKAPCMLLGLASGKGRDIQVADIGLTMDTIADGLAVGRPSGFVTNVASGLISGCMTVADETLCKFLRAYYSCEHDFLEPSACAGFQGAAMLCHSEAGQVYIRQKGLEAVMGQATHLIWTTGGGLVPEDARAEYGI